MKYKLIAYAAGLFDGEGFIRIQSHRSKSDEVMQIRGGICMTHPAALILMQRSFVGSLHSGGKRKMSTHKPLYQWAISSQKCATFLRLIRPFLHVKAAEVDVALQFQSHIDKWNYRNNRIAFRKER